MSTAMGTKIQTLERNWRRVASTHTLQDLMNADKPPEDTRISIKTLLSGILLITAGAACLALGILTFGAPWLLPESKNALLNAIRNDKYYHLLVPAMVPVTIITATTMQNHNLAQTPAKCLADYFPDVPDLKLMENAITGGLDPQFLPSPNLLDLPSGLENIWLASPWPRGAGAPNQYSHPQDVLNQQLAIQSAAAPVDPAALAQRGLTTNSNAFSLRATPNKLRPPTFPKLDAPSCSTVGTQTSPGLGCNANANRFAQKRPPAKVTRSVATSPLVAGIKNTAAQSKKQNSAPLQGASLPPLPKRSKVTPALAAASKPAPQQLVQQPQSQKQENNDNDSINKNKAGVNREITGTSIPFNAPLPSRGAKALNLAKTGPSTLGNTQISERHPGRPKKRQPDNSAPESAAATNANPSFEAINNNMSTHKDSTAPLKPPSGPCPSTFTAATESADLTGATTATASAYDHLLCEVCGLGEPEESIILCDGCDLGYHMGCLCPALSQVPEGSWFCSCCWNKHAADLNDLQEQQLAASHAAPASLPRPSSVPPTGTGTGATVQAGPMNQPPFPPPLPPPPPPSLSQYASRLLSLFSSSDVPKTVPKLARAQLQTLIYLAEQRQAKTFRIREYYNNKYIKIAVQKLRAAGLIVPVQPMQHSRDYTLSPLVVPTLDVWKQRLGTFNKVLEAAAPEMAGQSHQEDEDDDETESENDDGDGEDDGGEEDVNEAEEEDNDDDKAFDDDASQHGKRVSNTLLTVLRSSAAFSVKRKEEIRQAQLHTMIILKEHGASTVAQIRQHWDNDIGYHRSAVGILYDAGLLRRSGKRRFQYKYTLAPEAMPYIDELKARFQQHKLAGNDGIPSALFSILCSEDNNHSGGEVSALTDVYRRQLQALVYLAEHGTATTKCLQTHCNNDNMRNVMSTLAGAKMVTSVRRCTSAGNPHQYTLAPTMIDYLPLWKKKLENDALARTASHHHALKVNKVKK